MKTLVLYHGNCPDGLAAAAVLLDAFSLADIATEFRGVGYGQPAPLVKDAAGRDVVIVDFSYPRAVLQNLKALAASLVVLDHHKTAQADLSGLDFCTFDMDRSGATMAWDWAAQRGMRPSIPRLFAAYAEDRDLWRFKLPFSREINMVLKTIGHLDPNPDTMLWYARAFPGEITAESRGVVEGGAMLQHQEAMVRMMVANTQWFTIQGHRVPVVNASTTFSEVGEALCLKYPEAPFGAYYFDRGDGIRQWGRRWRRRWAAAGGGRVAAGDRKGERAVNERRTGGDAVNHPDHYQVTPFHVTEVQDVIEGFNLNFSRGNAVKYLLRAGLKGDELEDLKKVGWYLQREINRLANAQIDRAASR